MSHIHFTKEIRETLAKLITLGFNNNQIGNKLGMHRSSVGREIKRNSEEGVYKPGLANRISIERRYTAKIHILDTNKLLLKYVESKLNLDWSPEQISGRRRLENKESICAQTIYNYIYTIRKDLAIKLRRGKCKYRKRQGTKARMEYAKSIQIRNIKERDASVDSRQDIGHWEGDTVIGKEKTQRILTNVERKSGYGLACKLQLVRADIVNQITTKSFKRIPKEKRKTLTRDNGVEFGDYDKKLEEDLNMLVYRADPYRSSQRGTNENWNGLLRQYFPKGTNFDTITTQQLSCAVSSTLPT